jgi:Family of unknown function (DUF5317)
MFILYGIPLGIVLGYLLGGRLDRLENLDFRWGWLAVAGLLVQVILFSGVADPLAGGGIGEAVYVGSTAAVLVAVLGNVTVPGVPLVALGAISNLAAVVANGGVMPTTLAALEAAGLSPRQGFSNSAVLADPVLAPLTDVYAVPAGVPLSNVFSVGDVLIGVGIVVVIAMGMRRPS